MAGPQMRGPGGRRMMGGKRSKNPKKTLDRLMKYIGRGYGIQFGIVLICIIFSAVANVAGSMFLRDLIDDYVAPLLLQASPVFTQLIHALMVMAVIYLIGIATTFLYNWLMVGISQGVLKRVRDDMFEHMQTLPIRYFDTNTHGDLMSRMTNDVENISTTISQSIGSLISGVLTVLGSFAIMMVYSPLLTLISLSTIFLTIIVSSVMTKFMRKYFMQQQILLGRINGHVEEMVTGYRTVVAYSKEQDAIDEFSSMNDELRRCGIRAQICGGVMGPLMNCISNFGFVLIAAFGGWFTMRGMITVGTIQAFILYSKQFSRPINEIANQYANIQTAIAGAERIFEVMEAEHETDNGTSYFTAKNVKGDICFKDVVFGYEEGKTVLKGLDLDVKRGQKIAIVGATGSGKTTVVNLLTRFYDIDSGSITVDGVPITDIRMAELRRSIAIVLQDTVLFSGTIEDNIRYGKENASPEEVKAAAAHANADEFIERLPEGYAAQLSEGGSNLSQGQRQLLAIARAVLAEPPILILDEATSSVDTRTEMHIQSAMVALMKNRTSLIIAHRLSTIRDADKIVVIDGGRVAEMGSHDELIALGGCYYKLYQTQFAGNKT